MEDFMSNNGENDRVLVRAGARELTEEEIQKVSGAFIIGRCTFNPATCAMDGVCTPLPRCTP